jgi:hypothetical protein
VPCAKTPTLRQPWVERIVPEWFAPGVLVHLMPLEIRVDNGSAGEQQRRDTIRSLLEDTFRRWGLREGKLSFSIPTPGSDGHDTASGWTYWPARPAAVVLLALEAR